MSTIPNIPEASLTTAQIGGFETLSIAPIDIGALDQYTISATTTTHNSITSPFTYTTVGQLTTAQYGTFNTMSVNSIDEISVRTRNQKKYIIAGNYNEYKYFIDRKKFDPQEYIYVNNADTLRGLYNIHGYYVGSWRKRQDIDIIKMNIELANIE